MLRAGTLQMTGHLQLSRHYPGLWRSCEFVTSQHIRRSVCNTRSAIEVQSLVLL